MDWKDINMSEKGLIDKAKFIENYTTHHNVHLMVNSITINLEKLAFEDISKGKETEIIENLTLDQQHWAENSPGWLVLEALKHFIRA